MKTIIIPGNNNTDIVENLF